MVLTMRSTEELICYGSLILHNAYVGYAIVGVLAFVLGILVTMLCIQIGRLRGSKDSNED